MYRLLNHGLLAAAALLALPEATQVPTFDQVVDDLVNEGYPQRLMTGLAANTDRYPGNAADAATATYIRDEMLNIGLTDVGLEAIRGVDVFEARGATVRIGELSLPASQWPGIPGVHVTAEVVHLGAGTADAYAAAGDVTGKIALVDFMPRSVWPDMQGLEARSHGVAAMILTTSSSDLSRFASPRHLGNGTSLCFGDASSVPFVYISRADGDELKARVAAGPTTATIESNATTIVDGTAENVVGRIAGRDASGEQLIIACHMDGYFTGAFDNLPGVVGVLLAAKAMRLSGYAPERSVVFVAHTGEEWGRKDSPYPWLMGAYREIEKREDAWVGTTSCVLNIDGVGLGTAHIWTLAPHELKTWLGSVPGIGDANVFAPVTAYNDQFPYALKGIPSIYFGNETDAFELNTYHTDGDVPSLLDYTTLGINVKAAMRCVQGLDTVSSGLLPFKFSDLAADLSGSFAAEDLAAAGCDESGVACFAGAVRSFATAARAFDARAARIPAAHHVAVNHGLLEVERRLLSGLTALSARDDVVYPHDQVLNDVRRLNCAIVACGAQKKAEALTALDGVWRTLYIRPFSDASVRAFLSRYRPSNPLLGWASWARLAPALDTLDAYRRVAAGDYPGAVAAMTPLRDGDLADLDERLSAMSNTLEHVTLALEALR